MRKLLYGLAALLAVLATLGLSTGSANADTPTPSRGRIEHRSSAALAHLRALRDRG